MDSEGEKAKIGFLGFGEVARTLAQRMKEMGGDIFAFDKFADRVTKKAEELKIPLLGSLEELIRTCPLILSSIWPHKALDAAKEAAPFLHPGKIFCDMNSISPETTGEIASWISSSRADFVKIAVMAAIPDRGFAVPLLAGGTRAEEIAKTLSNLGLSIRAIGLDPRQPAAIKILRSICLKGVVALTYEMLRGAEKYGVADQVFESASETMARGSFRETVGNWLASTAIHARRRAKEMDEAIETLEVAGINPIMSVGIKEILEEIASFGLDEIFGGQTPDSFHQVFEKIGEQLEAKSKS